MFRPLLLALLFFSLPVLAGDGRPVSRPGVLHLDLEGAIRMALAKNFAIKVEEFGPRVAQENVGVARSIFDPVLEVGANRSYDSEHVALSNGERVRISTLTRNDVPLTLGLSGLSPLGTRYRLGWNSTRDASSTLLGYNAYAAGPDISITQPLLRDFGPTVNRYRIRIARSNLRISEWVLRQRVIDVVTELVYVYNELHFASEDLKVAESSRELANQLLQDNTQRATIGVMSPLDITTARAQVAAREEGVILARRTMLDNENLLKQLVTNDLHSMLSIRVEIDPPPRSNVDVSVDPGIRDALEFRPDFREAKLDLEQRHITVAYAKNQTLPRIDLTGSLKLAGIDSGYFGSVGHLASNDSLAYSYGIVFSIPLGNREARGNLNVANLEAGRALLNLQKLEQQIVVDVDNAAGQVTTDRARIRSTAEATRLARESLDAGEQRLRAGTGTTFEVLELQKQLADAESAELRAISDHNKAVAEFFRKTGTALQRHYIQLP